MADELFGELLRRTTYRDLNAAKRLVRLLEREQLTSDETNLIPSEADLARLARATINIYNTSHASEDIADLIYSSNLGERLAQDILKYFE